MGAYVALNLRLYMTFSIDVSCPDVQTSARTKAASWHQGCRLLNRDATFSLRSGGHGSHTFQKRISNFHLSDHKTVFNFVSVNLKWVLAERQRHFCIMFIYGSFFESRPFVYICGRYSELCSFRPIS